MIIDDHTSDKLRILVDMGIGLCTRLYLLRNVFLAQDDIKQSTSDEGDVDDPRIVTAFEVATIATACSECYPAIPDIHAYNDGHIFIDLASTIACKLEASIQLVMDIIDFLNESIVLLLSIPSLISEWSLGMNKNLSILYFDLLCSYVKVLKLLASIQEVNTIVAVYGACMYLSELNGIRNVHDAQAFRIAVSMKKSMSMDYSTSPTATTVAASTTADIVEDDTFYQGSSDNEFWSYTRDVRKLVLITCTNLPLHFISTFAPICSRTLIKPMLMQFKKTVLLLDDCNKMKSSGLFNPLNDDYIVGAVDVSTKSINNNLKDVTTGNTRKNSMIHFFNTVSATTAAAVAAAGDSSADSRSSHSEKVERVETYSELMHSNRYADYLIYAFIVCPHLLYDKEAYGLYRSVCSKRLFIELFRDTSINIHTEFEMYDKNFLDTKKQVDNGYTFNIQIPIEIIVTKAIKDVAKVAVKTCGVLQSYRRSFILNEIQTLVGLLNTIPLLIAPRIYQVLAAAAFANCEIMDYFRHQIDGDATKIRKDCRKLYIESDYRCNDVIILIHSLQSLIDIVIKACDSTIKPYYLNMYSTDDLPAMTQALQDCRVLFKTYDDRPHSHTSSSGSSSSSSSSGGCMSMYFTSLLSDLTAVTNSELTMDSHLEVEHIRLKWDRMVTVVSAIRNDRRASILQDDAFIKLYRIMFSVYDRSYMIDSVDLLMHVFCEPSGIWWYHEKMMRMCKDAIVDASEISSYYTCALTISRSIISIVHPDCPQEEKLLGATAVKTCDNILDDMGNQVLFKLKNIWLSFQSLDSVTRPIEAANRILRLIELKSSGIETDELVPEHYPGAESEFWAKSSISKLMSHSSNLINIVSASCKYGVFTVYNREYAPSIYIKDKVVCFLEEQLRALFSINRLPDSTSTAMSRPSSVMEKLVIGMYTSLTVLSFINTDALHDVRSLLFKEFVDVTVAPPGSSLAPTIISSSDHGNDSSSSSSGSSSSNSSSSSSSIISEIGQWFHDTVSRIASPLSGIVWSNADKHFVTNVSPFSSEDENDDGNEPIIDMYINTSDLQHLCMLIGPQGVRSIDAKLLGYIGSQLKDIFSFIDRNEAMLDTISMQYMDSSFDVSTCVCEDMGKFETALLNIGVALSLQESLHISLSESISTMSPLLSQTVSTAYTSIRENAMLMIGKQISILAGDVGVIPAIDLSLVSSLKRLCDDARSDSVRLDLFPTAAAMVLTSEHWARTSYLPHYQAFLGNEHCMFTSIPKLLLCFFDHRNGVASAVDVKGNSMTTHSKATSKQSYHDCRDAGIQYMRMSGQVLLQLYNKELEATISKRRNIPIRAMFTTLEMFLDRYPLVPRRELEQVVPYAFLHTNILEASTGRQKMADPIAPYSYGYRNDTDADGVSRHSIA